MAQGTRTATATSEAPADGAATSEAAPAVRSRPNRSYIVVPLPAELKARFEAEAEAADIGVGPYARNLIAKALGIEIPVSVTARRSKYSSDVERKAAQKARTQTRSSTMRTLMAAFRKMQQDGVSPEEAAQRAAAQVIAAGGGTPEPEPVGAGAGSAAE